MYGKLSKTWIGTGLVLAAAGALFAARGANADYHYDDCEEPDGAHWSSDVYYSCGDDALRCHASYYGDQTSRAYLQGDTGGGVYANISNNTFKVKARHGCGGVGTWTGSYSTDFNCGANCERSTAPNCPEDDFATGAACALSSQ